MCPGRADSIRPLSGQCRHRSTGRKRKRRSVEVGAVGSEGYVETDAALEAAIARRSAVCRFPGAVLQIEAGAFRELLQTQRQVLEAASCECYALIRDAR